MTSTFKLERLDGTPADPPTFETTELAWAPGDRIPLGAGRSRWFAFAGERDELPILVVEDVA
jgi:hypothetical protein